MNLKKFSVEKKRRNFRGLIKPNVSLPVTDVVFSEKPEQGQSFHSSCFLTISWGTEFMGKHWRLIAGVIEIQDSPVIQVEEY